MNEKRGFTARFRQWGKTGTHHSGLGGEDGGRPQIVVLVAGLDSPRDGTGDDADNDPVHTRNVKRSIS